MHSNRCGLPPLEHEVLFRRREIVETKMGSLEIVEVEIGGQLSVQLSHKNAKTTQRLANDRLLTGFNRH